MMVHTALLINLMKKQFTSMSNRAIPYKLSRRFQGILKKDFPAYHQQKKIFENWKDIYKLPLLQFGYKENLNCTEKDNKIDQKTQKCIIFGSTHLTVNQ